MYNYIPHPSNICKSSMLTSLLIEEGHAAYGIYWMVLELLRDCPAYKVGDSVKSIAWSIHSTDLELVDRVLHNYGLFDRDGDGLLFSPWLLEQMEAYDNKKKKLQEAGRRGAAKRFASRDNGEAIATPSSEDGEAKAILYNVSQRNVTQDNPTTSTEVGGEEWRKVCLCQGDKVDDELVSVLAMSQPEGHAPAYVAQICRQYGIGQNVMDYIIRITDNANLSNERYVKFVALIKRIEREKYSPAHPANFICSKIQ